MLTKQIIPAAPDTFVVDINDVLEERSKEKLNIETYPPTSKLVLAWHLEETQWGFQISAITSAGSRIDTQMCVVINPDCSLSYADCLFSDYESLLAWIDSLSEFALPEKKKKKSKSTLKAAA